MNDSELPEEVRRLIWSSVPSVDALELLVVLARGPERAWSAEALLNAVRPMKAAELRHYLALFQEYGLLIPGESDGVTYRPVTAALAAAMAGLCKAYDERPVTLIRTVYAIADARKIQSFADAFKIKKDS